MIIFLLSLCWGSFLNVLAYRLLHNKNFFTMRSICPYCSHQIAWYDNIPIVSWIILKQQCRNCKTKISWLYPCIEFTTAILLTFLHTIHIPANPLLIDYATFGSYFIFISALIVAIRTDLEAMVIPQIFTLWLIPIGCISAWMNIIDIFFIESLIGAIIGYGILWLIASIFKRFTGKDGLGIGDMELLALIGAFLGPIGAWISLIIGSFSGFIAGSIYLFKQKKNRMTRIPFGPFLAFGSLIYFFFQQYILNVLLLSL